MHFEPIDRFDNARCVTVCDSVKELSIPSHYRPIANMATISPKRGFSVATVAKGWSLVYMLMRVRYLVVFSLWKQ